MWANNPELSAPSVFSYRLKNGNLLNKRKLVADLPRPGEPISPKTQRLVYADLRTPTTATLRRAFEDLLDRIVSRDSRVTRREEQLDQLCNIFLLKLDSDKRAGAEPNNPPAFRLLESAHQTAENIRNALQAIRKPAARSLF